jgi:hypothetical protein
MANITIQVPPPLRRFVGGATHVHAEATTLREAVAVFTDRSDLLRGHLFDEKGCLRRFVRLFIDGQPAVLRAGEEQPIGDGAEITIMLALAGG